MKRKLLLALIAANLLSPNLASAHAFGQSYNLPIPVWMYLYGASAALVVSFLLVGFFIKQRDEKLREKILFKIDENFLFIIKILSLFFFFLVITAGFIGDSSPVRNLAPTSFWIILFLGMLYISFLLGNIWELINPIKTLVELLPDKNNIKYPLKAGFLPSVVLYIGIVWLELLSNGLAITPKFISIFCIFYLIYGLLFSWIFGKTNFLAYGDFFGVLSRVVSKSSWIFIDGGTLKIRKPFDGLLVKPENNIYLLLLVLFMLSSTAFDGLKSTKIWYQFNGVITAYLNGYTNNVYLQSFELLIFLSLFLGLYVLVVYLMTLLTSDKRGLKETSLRFIYSLVPIAAVYNLAHYWTLFFIQGQIFLNMISDPFNKGWNLFGTSGNYLNTSIISAKFIWNSQLLLILGGHIAAVYVAHKIALEFYKNHKKAVYSQLPMLLLMVIYTSFGLWILSQPLSLK